MRRERADHAREPSASVAVGVTGRSAVGGGDADAAAAECAADQPAEHAPRRRRRARCVGSSSSQSGRGATRSRASAARRFWPGREDARRQVARAPASPTASSAAADLAAAPP